MPLTFDLPYEELLTYQGINPRPDDFDDYWNDGLEQMLSLDPRVELVPAEFQASGCDCFDLFFTGVGGARVHAKLLRPTGLTVPHPAVLMFHGYSGNSGDWVVLAGIVVFYVVKHVEESKIPKELRDDAKQLHEVEKDIDKF